MARILVVEDDASARKLLCAVLRQAGYEPTPARNGQEALDALDVAPVDMIVSDVMMPVMDGMELTAALREAGYDLPILLLTAKQGREALRQGFESGADDYLTKPVDIQELVLRVKALLRRAHVADGSCIMAGDAKLDPTTLSVSKGDKTVSLPPKEFQLLSKLLLSPGKTFTRMQLLDDVWGWDSDSSEATVNVHINRLRSRFRDWDDFSIVTVRGLGYRGEVRGRE